MIGAAVSFLAFGLADLVAGGLKGTPESGLRSVLGIVAAALVVGTGATCVGWTGSLALVAAGLTAGVAAWLRLRLPRHPGPRRAWISLAVLALTLGLGVGSEALWRAPSMEWLNRWLETLAFPALETLEGPSLILLTAFFVFLSATTNGVVRAVLEAAGTETRHSEERLRGGRVIGVLERWMIFGLMLAGEPTAAGLVVSAKSLLRFPELNRVAEAPDAGDVDRVTEYFLLGSLVSWLLAVGLALLFVGPF